VRRRLLPLQAHEPAAIALGGGLPVAQHLQAAGLIRYRRGSMTILDRSGLEAAACECYGTIREQFNRLLA
jgi:hypothetical protein